MSLEELTDCEAPALWEPQERDFEPLAHLKPGDIFTNEDAIANRPIVSLSDASFALAKPMTHIRPLIDKGVIRAVPTGLAMPFVEWVDIAKHCTRADGSEPIHPDFYKWSTRENYRIAKAEEREHIASHPWEQTVVYFIECRIMELVKIGKADDVAKRFYGLRHTSPAPLRLIAIEPGSFKLERKLHRRFAKHRSHGEWFRIGPSIVKYAHALRGSHPLPELGDLVLPNKIRWRGPRDV